MHVKDGRLRAKQLYKSTDRQGNHINTPAVVGGAVYGFNGPGIECTNLDDGKLLWRREADEWYGNCQLIAADGMLFAQTRADEIVLIEANRTGYNELGRVKPGVPLGHQQQPTIANGKLYVRAENHVICYKVK
jgi:outer membrane protein assembly factor BamB